MLRYLRLPCSDSLRRMWLRLSWTWMKTLKEGGFSPSYQSIHSFSAFPPSSCCPSSSAPPSHCFRIQCLSRCSTRLLVPLPSLRTAFLRHFPSFPLSLRVRKSPPPPISAPNSAVCIPPPPPILRDRVSSCARRSCEITKLIA